MNAPLDPRQYSDPRDAAAAWFARARSGRMNDADRQDFDSWLEADPAHRKEYALLERVWESTGQAGHERLRALAGVPPAARRAPANRDRRAALGWALAGAGALGVAGLAVSVVQQGPPSFERSLATAHGQRQTVLLPDQSSIDLNTDSRAVVRYYANRREVHLEAGEASFSVSADPSRPFVVRAGRAAVRVTGTRFNVRRWDDATEVAVSAGTVEVRGRGWASWRRERLGPGQGLLASRDGMTPAAAVDVAAATAWREGRIVLNNTPLPQAVAELNRYAPFTIRLDGARLAQVRVSGTLNVDSPATLLELLPRIAPVRVQVEGQGRYVLMPAP
ncbi:fec operon regulator FecR [compost metagenome]|jgi:transmembrane sensor